MTITSCYQCPDRHVGCHADCERYLEDKKRFDEEHKKILDAKFIDNTLWGLATRKVRRSTDFRRKDYKDL